MSVFFYYKIDIKYFANQFTILENTYHFCSDKSFSVSVICAKLHYDRLRIKVPWRVRKALSRVSLHL